MAGIGLNLTGGGARGAYQAGVLKALSELLGEEKPIRYWSGVSAGAINQAYALSGLDNFEFAMKKLVRIWETLEPNSVYRTDLMWLGANSAKWIRDLSFGKSFQKKLAKSLLDTTPLFELLAKGVRFSKIQENLEKGLFDAALCSAYSYRDNRTVSFVQARENISWDRPRRYSVQTPIDVNHIMASCAIPIIFPSVKVDGQYMADGSFRSTAPVGPMVNLGADRILLVGVRGPSELKGQTYSKEPHLAKVAGLILNALFFDTIDVDIERIQHINTIMESTPDSGYSKIDLKVIRPSRDISGIAEERAKKGLPRTVSFLMAGLGGGPETSELASYILFQSQFTKELIQLGYEDFHNRKDEMAEWIFG